MSNISKKIQSINKQIEQATDCKQLAKVQQSAEKQLKKLLESLQKSLEKLKPMKEAGDSISEPSADPSKLLKTVQDIIKWIQLTVKTITDEITQVMADIAEITAALSELENTIASKANVLSCVIQNGQVQTPTEEDSTK